jgi:hypothetical protein
MVTQPDRPTPVCSGCGLYPRDIPEYVDAARDSGCTPARYVWREEGTLNPDNGHFLCTACYIRAGQPVGPNGTRWVAP